MNYEFFIPCRRLFNFDYDTYLYKTNIIPNKAIINREVWNIIIPNYYIVNRVRILTRDDRICSIYLDCPHPNADPLDFKYCPPESIIMEKLDDNSLYFLKRNIEYYNLDSYYFQPKDIKYLEKIGGVINANILGS